MPRFFFHTADGGRDIDDEGVELADATAARIEAVRYAGRVLQDNPDYVWNGGDFRVRVTDESGVLRCVIVILAIEEL